MSSGDNESAQQTLALTTQTYEEALKCEPFSIEALSQYAQLKQLLGDAEGGMKLAETALKYGRSKDEVQDMCGLYVLARAQYLALNEMRSHE